ncbi:MAG TPA: TolC family protein [Gemmatimonadaceae bacterium]|nr:TolC family protein [Gemmatimonadaceae bacterium]
MNIARSVALFLLCSLPAYSQVDTTISLADALTHAASASPDVARGKANVWEARSQQRLAVGAFLPQIAYQANFSNADLASPEPPLSLALPGPTYGTGVLASLDLFTAGRRGAQRRAADAERTAADASLVDRTYGARLTVEVAFLDVLRAEDLIKVSEARLARDQEALNVAQHRLEAGTSFRSDVLRAGVELSSAKEALLAAQAQYTSAAFELGRVTGLGRAVGANEADSTIVRPLPVPDREMVDLIVSGGPSVRSADATADAATASVRAAKSQYFPTINASGGYSVYSQPATRGPLIDGGQAWQFRVGVVYPIFDGFQREDGVSRADAEADAASATRADTKREARAAAERGLANLNVAGERIRLAEEAVVQATEDLRVQDARYQAGASTILDRLTSEATLVATEQDAVTARYDYGIARAQLEALAGRSL